MKKALEKQLQTNVLSVVCCQLAVGSQERQARDKSPHAQESRPVCIVSLIGVDRLDKTIHRQNEVLPSIRK